MIQDRRLFTATLFSMPLISLLGGCGGGADTYVSKPVEVTDELERQARAADDFFEKAAAILAGCAKLPKPSFVNRFANWQNQCLIAG